MSMQNLVEPKLPKWPFFLGDFFLLAAAYYVSVGVKGPIGLVQTCLVIVCMAGAACVAILPFVLEYRLVARLAESKGLTTVVGQIDNLEKVGSQITTATARWQAAQTEAEKVAAAAKNIADRMTSEVKAFTEFMQKVNDSEKSTLRLEVEKLRRAENEWLQVSVRMLDHVYALHLGALRTGQPKLIEQLGQFQLACRDAARRVGLAPFAANPADLFDAEKHQVLEANGTPPAGASVAETLATGYTFQGRLLRPALVRLQENGHAAGPADVTGEVSDPAQPDLLLDAAAPSPGSARAGAAE